MRSVGLVLLLVLIVSVAGYFAMEQSKEGAKEVVLSGNALEKFDLIRVALPKSGGVIQSPVTVQGKARGFWFFEADFPLRVEDAAGKLLGRGVAQAIGEWMSEDFVSFQATLSFERPSSEQGLLILERSNPSGLEENADELKVPIRFGM